MTQSQITETWNEYYPKIYGYYFRRLSNQADVEDLTSITLTSFLEVLINPDKQLANPHGFLWKIAHNQLCVFIKNKTKNPIPISLNENFEIDPEIEDYKSGYQTQRVSKLMECVQNSLTGIDKLIVTQVILYDQKAVDVAKEINLKPENVRQKLSRSLKKLRQTCIQIWKS